YEGGSAEFTILTYGGDTVQDYSLQVSSDSTNGSDGTWTTATDALTGIPVAIGGNYYTHRSHVIDFGGDAWIKIAITSSTASYMDELDLWDASTTTGD